MSFEVLNLARGTQGDPPWGPLERWGGTVTHRRGYAHHPAALRLVVFYTGLGPRPNAVLGNPGR